MLRTLAASLVVAALAAGFAGAQSGATIRGVVVDSTHQPLAGVDVRALPGMQRAQTDSTGRFQFIGLDGGQYTLRARRVGYVPVDWSVHVVKNGRTEVQIVLGSRISTLDTVRVVEGRTCEARSYEGFLCRRGSASGVFLDYADIDTAQVYYTADLLRDVDGFATRGARWCTTVLLNGAPASWSSIPDAPYMISAIEVYQSPKDIPKEFRRFTWGKENCRLVAYWSYDFMMRPIKKIALPRP